MRYSYIQINSKSLRNLRRYIAQFNEAQIGLVDYRSKKNSDPTQKRGSGTAPFIQDIIIFKNMQYTAASDGVANCYPIHARNGVRKLRFY